jgi:hypothetical protein
MGVLGPLGPADGPQDNLTGDRSAPAEGWCSIPMAIDGLLMICCVQNKPGCGVVYDSNSHDWLSFAIGAVSREGADQI